MKELDVFSKIGFFIVLTFALAISWWSLFTLSLSFAMPVVLAVGVSLAFDGAALFLAGMTSRSAREGDVSSMAKFGTYLVIAVSAYLNVLHAEALNLGLMGMIMFGASSVIAGVVFEVYLRYVHRQALKESGRVVEKFPVVGKLSFVFHPVIAFRVLDRTVRMRLYSASQQVSAYDPEDALFASRRRAKIPPVRKPVVKATAVREDSRADLEPKTDAASTISSLDGEKSVAALVRDIVSSGITDPEKIKDIISHAKGVSVPIGTVKKSINRMR